MSQVTVKETECKDKMNNLEKSLRKMFWAAILVITGLMCSGFAFYYNQQEKKINKIAVASIKADERLQKRLDAAEDRQRRIESQQAAMGAKIDANMKWLMDACARIETKQAVIEERLNNKP
jgi:hypothetical protein